MLSGQIRPGIIANARRETLGRPEVVCHCKQNKHEKKKGPANVNVVFKPA